MDTPNSNDATWVHPRLIAESQFQTASACAALFELRLRMYAGTHIALGNRRIDINLSPLIDAVVETRQADGRPLSDEQKRILRQAKDVRNKLLHCEFSSAREKLAADGETVRTGGVVQLSIPDGANGAQMFDLIDRHERGEDVGQVAVADTQTKKLCDVYAWLMEMASTGEFEKVIGVFSEAVAVVESLHHPKEAA